MKQTTSSETCIFFRFFSYLAKLQTPYFSKLMLNLFYIHLAFEIVYITLDRLLMAAVVPRRISEVN